MRNLANIMGKGNDAAIKAMHRCMKHSMGTHDLGVTVQPQWNCDGTKDYKSAFSRRSDSDYTKDPDTRKLVSSTRVSVNGAATQWRSATQKHITLSFAEAEQEAAVMCA